MFPKEVTDFKKVELKLAIKSSIPNLKPLLSIVFTLWKVTGELGNLSFSESQDNKIVIKKEIKDEIKNYFQNELEKTSLDENEFSEILDENNLVKSQIEALQVSLGLIWRVSNVVFEDEKLNFSSERQGGIRHKKILKFTKVMDQLDLLISIKEEEFKKVLFYWLTDKESDFEDIFQEKLIKAFTHFSEEAIFRLQIDKETDIKFMLNGIYQQITDHNSRIDIATGIEPKGSLRILQNILKDNLNYFLQKDSKQTHLKSAVNVASLNEYSERINNYLPLTNVKLEIIEPQDQNEPLPAEKIDKPYNRIIYGAPGTGKSFLLNQDRKDFQENFKRVTFYPNYTYSQFIGTYKPIPIYKEHLESHRFTKDIIKSEDINRLNEINEEYKDFYPIVNETSITYEYVPGPFLKILVEAIKDPTKNYLLIIEEINRAQVSTVFGDIFQLLDRDENGKSEYALTISNDMKNYLRREELELDEIYLPGNFYIWATMNSADQGVFPLDTAFKRRWDFQYLHLNDGERLIEKEVEIGYLSKKNWNNFRKALNDFLSNVGVREDKLIGPFFINPNILDNPIKFQEQLKNKLFMYLYDDVNKFTTTKLFVQDVVKFSDLLDIYNNNEPIFDSLFDDKLKLIEEEKEKNEGNESIEE
ncbi:AAA family ATPase [Alkalicoccobacillus gibsonii]|uniref:AAA family ATPase n=1 Tax=Alkalicoccobacillus gibsonii TaxID=79881 RepID=UPI0019347C2D|nr:AAA family ATPase [Alkalicoccobacillus gibsonii]MBM0066769.1 AAA family ATPase [Alkalicoccobacillus gibsonii]